MDFLQILAKGLTVMGITVATWFGAGSNELNVGATFQTPEVRSLFTTTLASRITDTATTMTLTSATDKDGNALASSTYGFIIDEGTSVEEFVLADCTSTACTNMTRGVSTATGTTTVSALKFEHRRGAEVKMTDASALIFVINAFKGKQNIENVLNYNSQVLLPNASTTSTQIPYVSWIFNNFVDKYNAQTVAGVKTFSSFPITPSSAPTTDYQVANKKYADDMVVAGGTDSSYTVKGVSERATVAEINAGSATGGTSAPLFINPNDFQYSTFASTTVYTIATTSVQNLASTTLSFPNIPTTATFIKFFFHATTTVPNGINPVPCISFNTYTGAVEYAYESNGNNGSGGGGGGTFTGDDICLINSIGANSGLTITGEIHDIPGEWKYGSFTSVSGTPISETFSFRLKNTARITSMTVSTGGIDTTKFATSTYITVTAN